MLVEGHLVEWLILAKCVTLLKYCVNKKNKIVFVSMCGRSRGVANIRNMPLNSQGKHILIAFAIAGHSY